MIDSTELRDKSIVTRTSAQLPPELVSLIESSKQRHGIELEIMKVVFQELSLTGPKGLKERTELFESRYDVLQTHFRN